MEAAFFYAALAWPNGIGQPQNRFFTPMSKLLDETSCRSCGACCTPQRNDAVYVGVSASDVARFSRNFRNQSVAHGAILTKLDLVGHCVCVALRGTVGKRVSCAIYERRPDECRRLAVGSPECLAARQQTGLDH